MTASIGQYHRWSSKAVLSSSALGGSSCHPLPARLRHLRTVSSAQTLLHRTKAPHTFGVSTIRHSLLPSRQALRSPAHPTSPTASSASPRHPSLLRQHQRQCIMTRGSTSAAPAHTASDIATTESAAGPAGMVARLHAASHAAPAYSDRLLPPPPYAPLVGSETGCFAHTTITTRLPAILESMIRDVASDLAEKAGVPNEEEARQIAAALSELRALRQAMLDDAPLQPLAVPGAPATAQVLLDAANACVELAASRQQRRQQEHPPRREGEQDGQDLQGPNAALLTQAGPGAAAWPTWLALPWLTVECYMYAAIHAALQRQPPLAGLDPFRRQKAAAWAKSAAAAAEMAEEVELLMGAVRGTRPQGTTASDSQQQQQHEAAGAVAAGAAAAAARAAALAGVQMALWGNKADLSLLVNAAGLDGLSLSVTAAASGSPSSAVAVSSAAVVEAAAVAAAAVATPQCAVTMNAVEAAAAEPSSRVIVDDSEAVWAVMAELRARRLAGVRIGGASEDGGGGNGSARGDGEGGDDGGDDEGAAVRVDIVLDNSGLELFADLCIADLLMEAGVADTVVLHGKPIPWFVSDTLEGDLGGLLDSCEAEASPSDQVSAAAWQPVRRLAARWRAHLASGRWRWAAHPFWCVPAPFCWMRTAAPDLYGSLAGSALVVFKGDLNYRKLTHDCRWPHTTPFETALQGFRLAPLVALRTLKADVVVGLAPGQSERLTEADTDWLVNGKWGMVQAAL